MGNGGFSFELKGLDELQRDFSKVLSRYPDETEKEVFHQAGQFTKDVNEKLKAETKQQSGKRDPQKEWHRSRERASFGGYTVSVEIQNTSPHWHLIEHGHVIRTDPKMYAAYAAGRLDHSKSKRKAKSRSRNPNLQMRGFAPGGNYCQRTRMEWEDKFPEAIQKFVDKMLKGNNL